MARESIFHKVVTREDSYTQLLANLMKRDPGIRSVVLALLFSKNLAEEVGFAAVQTQKVLGDDCGRPDIFIETTDLCLIVEVKTDPKRGLTGKQKSSVDAELVEVEKEAGSYLKHLRGKTQANRWLVFLAPQNWIFWGEVGTYLKWAHQAYPSIQTQIVPWEKVRTAISELPTPNSPAEEFVALLAERFGSITFFEEEIKLLFSQKFPIRAVWKLERLIDEIEKRAKTSGYESTRDNKRTDRKVDEYGIYLGKREKQDLYFGCWADFWEASGVPLCFGVCEPKLVEVFTEAYGGTTKMFEGYTVGWVTEEDLASSDAPYRVWKKLEPLLERLYPNTEPHTRELA